MSNPHTIPPLLWAVMSVAEVEETYHLAAGTARQAARRGVIPSRRAGRVYLVCRADADARWGDRQLPELTDRTGTDRTG